MTYRAMLLAAPHASDVAGAQAAGVLALEYALREKRCFATAVELRQGGRVYGLYEAVEPGVEGSRVYRRITGGPRVEVEAGWSYVAAAVPGKADMRQLAAVALGAASCLRGHAWFTHAGGVGFVEAFTPLEPGEALNCLLEALGASRAGKVLLPRQSLAEQARLFRGEGWRLYRYQQGDAEAEVRRNGYWARLSLGLLDGYVSDYWLTGVFYAAPPSEIYSVLNSLRGTRFDELVLFNLETAIERRLDVYGLEKSDIVELLRRLHEAVGEKYYTVPPKT